MSKLEKLLTDVLSKFNDGEISLCEARELFNKTKRTFWDADRGDICPEFDDEFTVKSIELAFEVLFKFTKLTDKFIERWQKGEVKSAVEELVLLSKAGDEIMSFMSWFQGRYFQIKHQHHLVCLDNDKQVKIFDSVQNIRNFEEWYTRQIYQGIPLAFLSKPKKQSSPFWKKPTGIILLISGLLILVGLSFLIGYCFAKKRKKK